MDLAQLKFVVDTTDLKNAAVEIEKLGTAVDKLNKPMQAATKASSNLNKEQSSSASASKQVEASVKKQVSVLERQQMILEFMAQGFSKGQSSTLAYAKANGIAADELNQLVNVLQTQRTLMGTDPFDKSIGALQSWTNKLNAATEAQNLYNQGIRLTYSQMEELGREKVRLIEKFKVEGKSVADAETEYKKLVSTATQLENTRQGIITSINASEKASLDAAKASAYLAKEDDRVNQLIASKGDITSATNNKLIRYEQELKKTGVTGAEAAAKLDVYKKKLTEIQGQAGQRQVDYLSRALGPQITDIFVGLATGQSPMMVLLQQGGQLRDQFALAGVAGKDMGDMLTKATLGMVSSVKDVGIAIGTSLIGAFGAAGKASLDFIGKITGVNTIVDSFKRVLASGGEENFKYIGTLNKIGTAFSILAGVGIAAAIAGFIAYGVALKEVINQESALSKAINLTGASLGLTTDSALSLSKALAGDKGNVGDYVNAITSIAKVGGITSDNLKTVAKTIVDVSKTTGISVDELAKNFGKLSEKPVEALIPLAKELGTIDVAILKQIQNLERAGKHTEAVKLATDSYAASLKKASESIKNDMGYLESFFKSIVDAAKSMWDKILNIGRKGTLDDQLEKAKAKMIELQNAGGTNVGRKDRMVAAQAEVIKGILEQMDAEAKLAKEKEKNAKDVATFEKTSKEQGSAQFKVPEDLNLKKLQENYKDTTKEIDSESKKLLAKNKAFYDLGISDLSTYLNEEIRLSTDQNNQKIALNNNYITQLEDAKVKQIKAINDINAAEYNKTKTSADAAKLDKERADKIKSVTESYNNLIQSIRTNNEVLQDKNAENYAKSIGMIGEYSKKAIEGVKEFIRTQDDLAQKRQMQIELDKETAGLHGAELARVKAEVEARQSHIKVLSDLQDAANKAKAALAGLNLAAMGPQTEEQIAAQNAVLIAQLELNKARQASDAAVSQAGKDAVRSYTDDSTKRLNAYGQAFENMFNGMGDAIAEFAKTGKLNFTDLVNSMIADLIRFEARKSIMTVYDNLGGAKGIFNILSGYTKGGSAASNMPDNIDIGGGWSPNANGAAYDNGIKAFANGGVFTNSIVSKPTLFKFAKGTGLMGEAGPEAIMPLTRDSNGRLGVQSSGSSSNVSVQVINNTSAQATTNETTDSKGNRKIEVVIGDMTAGEISRSGSSSQKSIRSTFGITPQLIRR